MPTTPQTNPVDAHAFLVPPLEENPTWEDMTDAFQAMQYRNVEGPTQQLLDIRQLRDVFDADILRQTCRMLGFDVSEDVLDTRTDLTRIVTQLPLYADQNGTELFTNFIELVLNGTVQVGYLYSEIDPNNKTYYKTFTHEPQGLNVAEGGTWFESTHIDLFIGLMLTSEQLNSLTFRPNQTLHQRVQELFLTLAPITLVVHRFYFVNTLRAKFMIGAEVVGSKAVVRRTVVAQQVGNNCDGLPFYNWGT